MANHADDQGHPGLPGNPRGDASRIPIDGLLFLMTIIWGTNYALVKSTFHELDPHAFNALRLVAASLLMAATSRLARRTHPLQGTSSLGLPQTLQDIFHTPAAVTRSDWLRLAWVGIAGHCLYQYFFIGGLARTSIANGALIISATPIVITVLSTVWGHERPGVAHWAGTLLSLFGIYIVVGQGAHVTSASLHGDVMMMVAVLCWAAYTLGARPLMERHSPVGVTSLSMLIGTTAYLPLAAPDLGQVAWTAVSALSWSKLLFSAVFSICVAYTIWYAAVRQIGSARTAVYSNLMPIVAMITGWVWLQEPIGMTKMLGAAAVLAGVAVARMRVFGRTMEGP